MSKIWVTNPFKPLVFGEELSYLEMIAKLRNRLNELNEYVIELQKTINQYTDQELAKIRIEFDNKLKKVYDTINEEFEEYKINTDKDIADFKNYVNIQLNKLSIDLITFFNTLTRQMDSKDSIVLNKAKQLIFELSLTIDKVNENNFRINNPTTGKKDTVQNTVNNIYDFLRFCLTCEEFEVLPITIEEVEELTVSDFELYSKWLLELQYRYLLVSNVTGDLVSHQQAVNECYDFVQLGSYTAAEWAELQFTIEEIDSKEVTAYNFDFYAKRFIY